MRAHDVHGTALNMGAVGPAPPGTYESVAWNLAIDKWVREGGPPWFIQDIRRCVDCGCDINDRHYSATMCLPCAAKRTALSTLHSTQRRRERQARDDV